MKRFTETAKWEDPWFRRLPLEAKLLWQWMCDKCDHAGVIEVDIDLAGFQIGVPISPSTMDHFADRIQLMHGGKHLIKKFVRFQYGKLSRSCKPHAPVFAALERHGLTEDAIEQNEFYKNAVDDYVRRRILERDGFRCAYTGKDIPEEEAVIDHIQPRSKGGTPTDDNLVVASAKMNSLKADLHVHRFCIAQSLDIYSVFQRLSEATGKPIESFQDPSIGYLGSLKEKEKDKDTDKDSSRARARETGEGELPGMPEHADPPPKPDRCLPDGWKKLNETQKKRTRCNFNTPTMIEVGKALGRKDTTLWTVAEAEALLALKPNPDEIDTILEFYDAVIPPEKDWRRRDLITLLNNWPGELDKARLWKSEQRQRQSA